MQHSSMLGMSAGAMILAISTSALAQSEPVALYATPSPSAEPELASSGDVKLRAAADFGGLVPLYHRIQLGKDSPDFDYVRDGGQDVVFPVARLSMHLDIHRHHVTLLYQPLELNTEVVLRKPLVVDGVRFDEGEAVDLKYGFPFYRASYTYDVVAEQTWRLSLGGSLQLRDATITFTSADGSQRRTRRDVGPVPALKGLLRYDAPSGWFSQVEIDGMYAPVKYINGGDSDVEGAIIDANLRFGYRVSPRADAFVNLRWLGGGAEGTSDPKDFDDGYNQNWLQFLIFSAGVDLTIL
jgi:hypothetical protein